MRFAWACRALAAVALLLATACPDEPVRQPGRKVELEEGKQPAASPPHVAGRTGVKIPRPDGWTVRVGPEQSLAIGPANRTVLRIDIRPGAADQLPSTEMLERTFAKHLQNNRATRVEVESTSDTRLVVLMLEPKEHKGADASVPPRRRVLLGAKRVGADLFLCATQPGASDDDVKQAMGSCRDIGLPTPL
jgi:hypothetical protein